MQMICNIGLHRADPFPRWSDGFYFSKCRRCGKDVVRTGHEGWKVAMAEAIQPRASSERLIFSMAPDAMRPGATAMLALAIGAVAIAAMGVAAEDSPIPAVAQQVSEPRVKAGEPLVQAGPKVLAPQPVAGTIQTLSSASKIHQTVALEQLETDQLELKPLKSPSKNHSAHVSPSRPIKTKIKYRYSANMRLFCQRAGRQTPECRVFREQTGLKRL